MTREEALGKLAELHNQACRSTAPSFHVKIIDAVDLVMDVQRQAVELCCEIARQRVGPDKTIGVYADLFSIEIVDAIRAEFADVLKPEPQPGATFVQAALDEEDD
jgi:hypothetical protein